MNSSNKKDVEVMGEPIVPERLALSDIVFGVPQASLGVGVFLTGLAFRSATAFISNLASPRALFGALPAARVAAGLIRNEVRGSHRVGHLCLKSKIHAAGYVSEEHLAHTDDGYTLTLIRIPGRLKEHMLNVRKPVAFVQHGLKSSAADFHVGGMAYCLVEAGFDVWLGNFRGNRFSNRHVHLGMDDPEFWDFSWDEHGRYDLPAMLDTVLRTTGRDSVEYIGHSMGVTALFVMVNVYPERYAQIAHCTALAPVTRIAHVAGIPSYFLRAAELSALAANAVGIYHFDFPRCIPGYSLLCTLVMMAIGYNEAEPRRAGEVLEFSPSPCSTTTVRHYIACHRSGRFCSRDGSINYDLSAVRCPVDIWWSSEDWAAGEKDIAEITESLPHVTSVQKLDSKDFGHQDFTWANSARMVLHEKVAERLKERTVKEPTPDLLLFEGRKNQSM